MAQQEELSEGKKFFLVIFFVCLLLGLMSLYDYYKIYLHIAMTNLSYWQFKLYSFLGLETAKEGLEFYETFDYADYTETASYVYILDIASRITGIIIGIIMLYFTFCSLRLGFVYKFQYKHTPKSLIKENAKIFPCLRPVLLFDIKNEDIIDGIWRFSYQPIQFAIKYNLLLLPDGSAVDKDFKRGKRGLVMDENFFAREDSPCLPDEKNKYNPDYALTLDVQKAESIFLEQVSRKFEISNMKNYEKGLLAALLAQACGNKKKAQEILDFMSSSYFYQKKTFFKKEILTISVPDETDDIILKYMSNDIIQDAYKLHGAFFYPFFIKLFQLAKKKGILITSEFIWLRTLDITFYLTLNSVGSPTVFIESAGIWSHFRAEEIAEKKLTVPYIKKAIEALHEQLEKEGWLPIVYSNKKTSFATEEEKEEFNASQRAYAKYQQQKSRGRNY